MLFESYIFNTQHFYYLILILRLIHESYFLNLPLTHCKTQISFSWFPPFDVSLDRMGIVSMCRMSSEEDKLKAACSMEMVWVHESVVMKSYMQNLGSSSFIVFSCKTYIS